MSNSRLNIRLKPSPVKNESGKKPTVEEINNKFEEYNKSRQIKLKMLTDQKERKEREELELANQKLTNKSKIPSRKKIDGDQLWDKEGNLIDRRDQNNKINEVHNAPKEIEENDNLKFVNQFKIQDFLSRNKEYENRRKEIRSQSSQNSTPQNSGKSSRQGTPSKKELRQKQIDFIKRQEQFDSERKKRKKEEMKEGERNHTPSTYMSPESKAICPDSKKRKQPRKMSEEKYSFFPDLSLSHKRTSELIEIHENKKNKNYSQAEQDDNYMLDDDVNNKKKTINKKNYQPKYPKHSVFIERHDQYMEKTKEKREKKKEALNKLFPEPQSDTPKNREEEEENPPFKFQKKPLERVRKVIDAIKMLKESSSEYYEYSESEDQKEEEN